MNFKNFAVAVVMMMTPIFVFSQFKQVVVEEIDNEGKVPGRTYRIYAELTNIKDQVYVIFGDSVHKLEIKSSKPFYQSKTGGALAKNIQRKEAMENPQLKYDSWVTIGAEDNYENNLNVLSVDLEEFESEGGPIQIKKDGAWFCIPSDKQAWCMKDTKMLLMQLTTEGEINGQFSIMGKTAGGVAYTNHDVTFRCGEKKKK